MNTRFLLRWLIAVVFLFSLPACSPTATAEPEITLVPTEVPATEELTALPTETATDVSVPAGPVIERMKAGATIQLTFIRMVTVDIGWAIGGVNQVGDHVFYTLDGGETWEDVTPPEPVPAEEAALSALGFFKNATTAWVVYGFADPWGVPEALNVWHTQDAGVTWQPGSVDTSIGEESFSPLFLTFADDTHGWLMVALGAGMSHVYVAIFATTDGGVTWTDILDPFSDGNIQSFAKTDLYFTDALNGWLTRDSYGVDSSPHVFNTTDGGVTWERIDLPAPAEMPQLSNEYYCGTYTTNVFSPTSVIIAVRCRNMENIDTQLNYQYATTDGGQTWKILPLPEGYVMGSSTDGLYYFDENYGFALGRNLYQTTDGGVNWMLIKQVAWDGQFSFVNMNSGWAVARSEGELALVRTTSGGPRKWEILNPYIAP